MKFVKANWWFANIICTLACKSAMWSIRKITALIEWFMSNEFTANLSEPNEIAGIIWIKYFLNAFDISLFKADWICLHLIVECALQSCENWLLQFNQWHCGEKWFNFEWENIVPTATFLTIRMDVSRWYKQLDEVIYSTLLRNLTRMHHFGIKQCWISVGTSTIVLMNVNLLFDTIVVDGSILKLYYLNLALEKRQFILDGRITSMSKLYLLMKMFALSSSKNRNWTFWNMIWTF